MPTFDSLLLRTERLLLRPLAEDDAPALYAMCADPQVMRYWSTPPWQSIEPAQALIARDIKAMAAGDYLRLALERIDDGQFIGNCTLFSLMPQCRRAELGYAIAHAHWGRGYMHEALVALLDHGFTQLALNRVEADVDPRNLPSVRSLERLGFTREGLLRERWIVGDEVSDSALYGLLAGDWRKAHPGAATNET